MSNYEFFKSVLKTTMEQHKKMLKGKSSYSSKYEHELKEIRDKLYRCWKYHKELTDKEYYELQSAFGKISFMNLADQRKGKPITW